MSNDIACECFYNGEDWEISFELYSNCVQIFKQSHLDNIDKPRFRLPSFQEIESAYNAFQPLKKDFPVTFGILATFLKSCEW